MVQYAMCKLHCENSPNCTLVHAKKRKARHAKDAWPTFTMICAGHSCLATVEATPSLQHAALHAAKGKRAGGARPCAPVRPRTPRGPPTPLAVRSDPHAEGETAPPRHCLPRRSAQQRIQEKSRAAIKCSTRSRNQYRGGGGRPLPSAPRNGRRRR